MPIINPFRKGANAEREIAHILSRATGHAWKRIGMPEKHKVSLCGDVRDMCKDSSCPYKRIYIDVKNRQNNGPKARMEWWEKTVDDANTEEPILIYKKDRQWFVKDNGGEYTL